MEMCCSATEFIQYRGTSPKLLQFGFYLFCKCNKAHRVSKLASNALWPLHIILLDYTTSCCMTDLRLWMWGDDWVCSRKTTPGYICLFFQALQSFLMSPSRTRGPVLHTITGHRGLLAPLETVGLNMGSVFVGTCAGFRWIRVCWDFLHRGHLHCL